MMELWQPETSLQPMQGPVPETTITDEHVPVRMTQVQHAATKERRSSNGQPGESLPSPMPRDASEPRK